MNKKLLSIKTLLVAAGLCVGANVWADDITLLPFNKTWASTDAEDATSPFSDGKVKTAGNITALSVNNTTATAYFDTDAETDGRQVYTLVTNEEVTVSLTAYHGWLSGGKAQGVKLINSQGNVIAEYVYNVGSCNITDVKIGGSKASEFSEAYNCQSKFNATKNSNGFTSNNYQTTDGYNPTFTFKVRYDGYVTLNVSMSSKTIDNTYTGNLPSEWNIDIASIQAYASSDNADRTLAINNLSVTSAVATRADYTVRYVDSESNKIDEDVVYSGVVGDVPTLISGDKASRYNAGSTLKYVYASDDASSKTIASDGSTVVTVTFNSYGKYDYSVTTSVGTAIDSGSLFEDETKTISWPKYIEKDGVYYQATAPFQFTVSNDAKTKEVSVTASQVKQVVEATSSNWATTGVENANLSGGVAYRGVSKDGTKTMLTVEETGVYSIIYAVFSTNTGSGKEFDFSIYKNDASVDANLIETFSVNHSVTYVLSTGTRTINNVLLVAGDKIVAKSGNTTCALDYIAIAKTGEATVSGTIPSSGYGSLASAYGLDFSNVTVSTGTLTAYVVTATTNDAVTLTSVSELPANQGVILKGEGGAAYSIPVKADAAYDGTNLLSAAVTATDIDANTAYILQDGLFHLVTAASTVPAGKAYLLKSNVPSAARALGFTFADDEDTGISAVTLDRQNGEFYNLQGQRVDAPKKGLYIVNGVKVIIK